MFRLVLAALSVALIPFSGSDAQDWPARFAQPEQFRSADLSPSGDRIAYIAYEQTGESFVAIADSAAPNEILDRLQFGATTFPSGVVWLDDDVVYLSMGVRLEDDGDVTFQELRLIRRLADGRMVRAAADMDVLSTATGHSGEVLFAQYLPRGAHIFELDLDSFDFDRHSNITSQNGPPASFVIGPRGRRALTLIGERGLFRLSSAMSDLPRGVIHRETFTIDREARFERSNWSRWSGVVGRLEGLLPDGERAVFSTTLDAPDAVPRPGGRAALYTIDVRDGTIAGPLLESPDGDVSTIIRDWRDNAVIGAASGGARAETRYFSDSFANLQVALEARYPGQRVQLRDWSESLSVVLYEVETAGQPGELFLYFAETEQVVAVGARYPAIGVDDGVALEVLDYQTGDGMSQFAYLTLPAQTDDATPAPLIVMPHGGPQSRDYDSFDPLVQIFARAGYAVLQPQFRGSRGFGLDFMDAGEGEWAASMQSDIYDAMDAAGADPRISQERACIVGWSYGGYAALVSAVDESDRFMCTVSIAGVSDIRELMEHDSNEDAWGERLYWSRVIGNWHHWGRDEDVLSPARRALNLSRPLLLAHGERDPIVPVEQSRIFEDAVEAVDQDALVTSLYFEEAGHAYRSFSGRDLYRLLTTTLQFVQAHNPAVIETPDMAAPVEHAPEPR